MTSLDNGVQCNIANLPSLNLLTSGPISLGHTQDYAVEQNQHCSPEEEPFEELDVDDEDYNPSTESEEDEDEKELKKSERWEQ